MIKSKFSLLMVGLGILLSSCSHQLHVVKTDMQSLSISENLPKDSIIMALYSPYKKKLDSIMNDVVAVSEMEIIKAQPEGALNNFFADAMYESAKDWGLDFDFAYTNYGGLRVPLPKGNIYRYQIFELMPFENAFTVVTFKGEDIQAFFNYVAEGSGDPISGARFIIDGKNATSITIDGKAFDPKKNYKILTSDYMANGGDGGAIFNRALHRKDFNYKLRDALFLYLENLKADGKTLNPANDGRIKIK